MNNKKLSIEEFNQRKEILGNIFHEVEVLDEISQEDYDAQREEVEKRYINAQNELLSYDLSEIPYEAYAGMEFAGNADFSNTHANIDFNILNTDNIDSINVKGCNIRNLESLDISLLTENAFDEKIIDENPNLFLSQTFTKDFREKYYSYTLTMDDFLSLTTEQLQEVEEKGSQVTQSQLPPHFFRTDNETRTMIEMLGLVNAVRLYRDNREDYQEISTIFQRNSASASIAFGYQNYGITDLDVRDILRASDNSHIKEVFYQTVRTKILERWNTINPEQFSQQFIEANEDIFLTHHPISEELREKIYAKSLTYQDLSDNIDSLKDTPYSYFLDQQSERNLVQKLGTDNFSYLLEHYKSAMDNLYQTNYISRLENFNSENIIDRFPQLMALNIHERNNFTNVTDISRITLPDWAVSLDYKIVPRYQNLAELLTYDNHTLITDYGQQRFLYALGYKQPQRLKAVKDIIEFENKYHFFENYNRMYNMDFASAISRLGTNLTREQLMTNSYSTFEEFVMDYLEKQSSNKGIRYDKILDDSDDSIREKYPQLFISKDCPEKLQEAFYKNSLTTELLKNNRKYMKELVGKSLTISSRRDNKKNTYNIRQLNISGAFNQEKFLNLIADYGPFPFTITLNKKEPSLPPEEIEKAFYDGIYQSIVIDHTLYKDLKNIPAFLFSYPELFLGDMVPEEIQDMFYNRQINEKFITEHRDLLDYFPNTKIMYGLEKYTDFLKDLYTEENISEQNKRHLFIYRQLQKLNTDGETLDVIKDYIQNHDYDEEKISKVIKLSERVVHSNSQDMRTLSSQIVASIVNQDNPEEKLERIENIFLQNNLPFFAKVYYCFEILHPDLEGFNFKSNSRVAPELKDDSLPKIGTVQDANTTRFQIIFNDIFRITYSSNNRDFQAYLKNIEFGNDCYNLMRQGNFNSSNLTSKQQKELSTFADHLEALYRITIPDQQNSVNLDAYPLDAKIRLLGDAFLPNERYDLKDRIVRSFGYFAGIKSFNQLKEKTISIHEQADRRGRAYAKKLQEEPFHFEEGDFVRGIGNYDILGSTLQHGNVSKEFLTTFLKKKINSDTTPLDVDLTCVDKTTDIYHTISDTPTGFGFGNLFVIIKKDNPKMNITRDKDGNLTGAEYDPTKFEAFGTQVEQKGYETHWGVRTGFSFSDVDYILYKKKRSINQYVPYDEKGNVNYVPELANEKKEDDLPAIKFEIARNGVYIPVIDFSGKLIYTEQEYDNIRSKMQGLSYYGTDEYTISSNLKDEKVEQIVNTISSIEQDNIQKHDAINKTIGEALSSLGITLKDKIDHKLETGTAELIDTGSTGRNTNIAGKGDYDYIMRLDNSLMSNPDKLEEIREKLLQTLGEEHRSEMVNGNFRFKEVKIPGLVEPVDIDISFIQKTDKMDYSSDEALRDRLQSIREQHPEDYKFVLANIIEAKTTLKEGKVYKKQQGGISGIGIENWILQNGGSFQDAATSFMEASKGKSLEEFKETYQIWDFGENHYADEKGIYKHDNFISNLTEEGYTKMQQQLSNYLEKRKSKNELNAMVGEKSSGQVVTRSSTVSF